MVVGLSGVQFGLISYKYYKIVLQTAKQESDLFNHEYDYRLNWTTQSPVIN